MPVEAEGTCEFFKNGKRGGGLLPWILFGMIFDMFFEMPSFPESLGRRCDKLQSDHCTSLATKDIFYTSRHPNEFAGWN